MSVRFTDEQLNAIETLDRSVLVSAAAGSGKTAVLVERILKIILDGKANVDEMLIVTFTRAAAAEMKLRLASRIRKRIRECPDEAERLSDQLSRLYRSYITTIDSFAMRVIREFFYEIDIEPDFGACDEVQSELMKREALQELFEAGFEDDMFLSRSSGSNGEASACETDRVGFREFLRLYSEERQEDTFKERLLSAYNGLRSIPDYFDWAYERAELLRVTPETFEGSRLKAMMFDDAKETFGRAADAERRLISLMQETGLESMLERLEPEISVIENITAKLADGILDKEVIEAAASVKSVTLKARKNEKEAYEPVKDEVKALREAIKEELKGWNGRYAVPDFDTRLSEMNETYRYTVYFIRLLEEFERRYAAKKRERRVMDFPDMEHGAVRILRDPEAADTLRRRFRFIFVDEYQDTNRIQEALISSIARPDNVFRVGDIKQSIYKFRQAEPSIFREVYRRFSDTASDTGIAIDLGKNFRSNDATVRYINTVFSEIMEDYDERAMLYTGTECPAQYDFLPEVHVLTDDSTTEDEEEEDETLKLSKAEAEAKYIAGLAQKLIGTEFYDTKEGVIRKAEARDIVILLRVVSVRGEIMARALRSCGIEPYVEDTDDYFDTVEVGIAVSLLSCIDNMKRDIPLIASLHSEAFGWTPEELSEVRIAYSEHLKEEREKASDEKRHTHLRRPAFWEAMKWYREEGPECALREKAVYAAEKILEWRRMSRMMPLDDFVWAVLTDSGYYRMAGAMNGGARRQANLRALADRAGRYSKDTIASLSSFIRFVDVMREKGISNGQTPAAGPGDDVIRISTIHKSKGLEYPFVIVGDIGHRFRYDKNEKSFSFDSDIGVGLPYIDPARRYWRSTIVQRSINAKSSRDIYEEELRILYVAMTRARNKLILVGTCKSEEDLEKYKARPSSCLKVMKDVIRTGFNTCYVRPLDYSDQSTDAPVRRIPEPDAIELTPDETILYDELDRRFTYQYPDADLLTSKAKYSVSALRREALDEEDRSDHSEESDTGYGSEDQAVVTQPDTEVVNLWAAGERHKRASASDIGIAYHRIMEFLDFARAVSPDGQTDEAYIHERAEMLAEQGAVEPHVYRDLDLGRITAFFSTDIGRRAADAAGKGALKKEKPFTLRTEKDGNSILVQGVIDCCFEEDGRVVLLDYKSSFIHPGKDHDTEVERIRHEYSMQIDLYREAILKGTGKDVSEAYLYLFTTGEAVSML